MSNVIKNKRNLSDFEFSRNLIKLRKEMTDLLLRDFGLKKNKPKEDEEASDDYPEWLIIEMRKSIFDYLREIGKYICLGNSIFPTTWDEFKERRAAQNRAIGLCFGLLSEMQYIIDALSGRVDVSKYMPFVDTINREIALLKGWRKSGNKLKKFLKKSEGSKKPEENHK